MCFAIVTSVFGFCSVAWPIGIAENTNRAHAHDCCFFFCQHPLVSSVSAATVVLESRGSSCHPGCSIDQACISVAPDLVVLPIVSSMSLPLMNPWPIAASHRRASKPCSCKRLLLLLLPEPICEIVQRSHHGKQALAMSSELVHRTSMHFYCP